jgi:enoyl-[acyl-carrier protein] reductase I
LGVLRSGPALLDEAAERAPARHQVSIEDVGAVAACLVSDAARALTDHTAYVDAGFHILG